MPLLPAPRELAVWVVSDSLCRGYLDVAADRPYVLHSVLAQRATAGRGWVASDPRIRFVGSQYTATPGILGDSTPCDVVAGSTLAEAISGFAAALAACQAIPDTVVLERGPNDIGGGASAATVLADTVTWWGLVRTALPRARKIQVRPWARAGASAARLAYLAGLDAGQAGADVELCSWAAIPDPGCFTNDPSGVHADLPSAPTTWSTWIGAQDGLGGRASYQSDVSWQARALLETLVGRSITSLPGEVYP